MGANKERKWVCMKTKQTDIIFDRITCNESREMTKTRFHQAVNEIKSASDFVQSIADKTEYIDGGQYKNECKNDYIPVIEYNELIELAAKYDKK